MNRRWKRSHVIEMVLLLTGMVFFGIFLWDKVATEFEQRRADAELERQMEKSRGEETGKTREEQAQKSDEKQEAREEADRGRASKSRGTPERGTLIGRVEIPRLKIAAVVRSGVDSRTLKRAVGHVPSTALPGERGNVALAAHRDKFFRNLRGVRKGDTIRIVTPQGNFAYEVESTQIVMPKNVEVLNPTQDNALTLVTCYPFNYVGSAPNRFVVRAKQVLQRETSAGL